MRLRRRPAGLSWHMRYYFTSHSRKKMGPFLWIATVRSRRPKKKTKTLYCTGNSPVKSICLISTENLIFSGPVAPAVCLCLSSDCCQQPAAQAADGNAALRRCDVVRDEVICLTPSKKHLYLNHPPLHSSRLKRKYKRRHASPSIKRRGGKQMNIGYLFS